MGQAISRRRSYTPGRTKNTEVAFPSAENPEESTNGNVDVLKDEDQLPVSKTHMSVTSPSLSTPVAKTDRRKRFLVGFPLRRTPSGRWSRRRRSTPHNGVRHPVTVTSSVNGGGHSVLGETSDIGNTSNGMPEETEKRSLTPSVKTNKKESSMKFLGRKNKEKRNSKGKKKKGRNSSLKHEGNVHVDGMKEIADNVESQLSGDVLKEVESDTVTSFIPPEHEEDTGESTGKSLVVAEAHICNLPKLSRTNTNEVAVGPSHVLSEPSHVTSELMEKISEFKVIAREYAETKQNENQHLTQTVNSVEKLSTTQWNHDSEPEGADLFYTQEMLPQGRQHAGSNTLTYDSTPNKSESGNMAVEMDHEISQIFSSADFPGAQLENEKLFQRTNRSFEHSTHQNDDDSFVFQRVFDNDEAEFRSSLINHEKLTGSVPDESIKVNNQVRQQELAHSSPTELIIVSDDSNTVDSSQTRHFQSAIDDFDVRNEIYNSFWTSFVSEERFHENSSNHEFTTRSNNIEDTDNSLYFYTLSESVSRKNESECEAEGVPEELSDYLVFPESSDASLIIGRMSDVSFTSGQLTDVSILINQNADSSQESISKEETENKKEDVNYQSSSPQREIFKGLSQGKKEEYLFNTEMFPRVEVDSSLEESNWKIDFEKTEINLATLVSVETERYTPEYVQNGKIDKAFQNENLSKEYDQFSMPEPDSADNKKDRNLPKEPEAIHLEDTTDKKRETPEISNEVVDNLDGLFLSKEEWSVHSDETQISNRNSCGEPLKISEPINLLQLPSTHEVKNMTPGASFEVPPHNISSVKDSSLSRDLGDVVFEKDRYHKRVSDVVSPEDRYVSFTDVSFSSSHSSSNPTSPLSVSMTELNASPMDRDSREQSHYLKKIALGPRLRTAILRKGSSGASSATPADKKMILLTRPISIDFTDLEKQGQITKVTHMDSKSPNANGTLNAIASTPARTPLDACNNPYHTLSEVKTEETSKCQEFPSVQSSERIHLMMTKERITPSPDVQTNITSNSECPGIQAISSEIVTTRTLQIHETVHVITEDTLIPKYTKDELYHTADLGKPSQTSVGVNTDDIEENAKDSLEVIKGDITEIKTSTDTNTADLNNEASNLIAFQEAKYVTISSEVDKIEFVNSSGLLSANRVESVNISPVDRSRTSPHSVDHSEDPLDDSTSVTELHSSSLNQNYQIVWEERVMSDMEKTQPTPIFFTYESKLEVQLERKFDRNSEIQEKCRIRVFSRDSQSLSDTDLNVSPSLINATQRGHTSSPISISTDEHHNDSEEVFNSDTHGDLQSNKSNTLAKSTKEDSTYVSAPALPSESSTTGFAFGDFNVLFADAKTVLKDSNENGLDTKHYVDSVAEVLTSEFRSTLSTQPQEDTHLCDEDSMVVLAVHQGAQNKEPHCTDDHTCPNDNGQQHCVKRARTVTEYPIGILAASESNEFDQHPQKESLNGDESPNEANGREGSFSNPEVMNLVRHVAETADINSNCRHGNNDRHLSKEDRSLTEFSINNNKECYLDSNNGHTNGILNGGYSNINKHKESYGRCVFPGNDNDDTDVAVITNEETVTQLRELLHCRNGTEHFENNNHINCIDSALESTTHF